jgi:hypothetical protein
VLGAVLVEGGAENVREPRLPELEPAPTRASASTDMKVNTEAKAKSARTGRMYRKRVIGISQESSF